MIAKEKITSLIGEHLAASNLFLVELDISAENDIKISIESDNYVDIDDCAKISRIVEQGLDREEEDFSLTVTSAGLDMPFKVLRQYEKFIGKEVEIILKKGIRIIATLNSVNEEGLRLTRTVKVKKEGDKRPVNEDITESYKMEDIKSTRPHINFK